MDPDQTRDDLNAALDRYVFQNDTLDVAADLYADLAEWVERGGFHGVTHLQALRRYQIHQEQQDLD